MLGSWPFVTDAQGQQQSYWCTEQSLSTYRLEEVKRKQRKDEKRKTGAPLRPRKDLAVSCPQLGFEISTSIVATPAMSEVYIIVSFVLMSVGQVVCLSTAPNIFETCPLLQNVRVVQRNLVYVVGLALELCYEDLLKTDKYFGQFGKIIKVRTLPHCSFHTYTPLLPSGVLPLS